MPNPLDRLRERLGELTPKQRQVADLVLGHPAPASYATAAELARQAGVTPATVVRFCQTLGFTGYTDFRQQLRHAQLSALREPLEVMEAQMAGAGSPDLDMFTASIRRDLANVQALLANPNQPGVQEAINRLTRARRVLIISTGSYAAVALVMSHLLNFMGLPTELENRGGTYLGQRIALLAPEDLLLAISFWHTNTELVRALEWARAQGIPTLAITDYNLSPLAMAAEQAIAVATEGVSFFQSIAAPLCLANALIATAAVARWETAHPAIGRAQAAYDYLAMHMEKPRKAPEPGSPA